MTISSSIKFCAILADKSPNFSKIFLLEYDDDLGDDDLDNDDQGDDDLDDDDLDDDDLGDDDLSGIIINKKIFIYIWV